jgi:epoxide hydrolase-like predicted phosphatase
MTSSVGRAFAEFCLREGVDPERLTAVVAEAYGKGEREGMIERVERGALSTSAFERWLADQLSQGLPRPLSPRGLRRRLFAHMQRDDRMARAVRLLRHMGVGTALISNTWGAPTLVRRRELDRWFDVVLRSDEVGLRKPQPEIYLLAAGRLGVRPDECVFVDDLAFNLDPARELGMAVVHHTSAGSTLAELDELLC